MKLIGASTPAVGWGNCRDRADSTGAVQQQPMQRHNFRLCRFELDLRKRPLRDFHPAVNSRLGFHFFPANQTPQKNLGFFPLSNFAKVWTCQRFHRVTAHSLVQ